MVGCIVESLSRRVLVASRVVVRKVSQEEMNRERQVEETLSLMSRFEATKKEVESLSKLGYLYKEENILLKDKNKKLEEAMTDSESVLENLRKMVEWDANEITSLKDRVKSLEA